MWHFILLLQYFNHISLYKNSKPTLLPLSHGLVCREKWPVSRPSSSWTQEHISVYTIILINSYRLAVEYTYLLRRPVSTGSNKQATANTQITAWVSLWLTLLTSWFVFTLVLKNYRKCEICLVKNSLLFTGVLLWPTTSLCQCKFQVKSAHRIKNKTTLNKSKLKVPIQRQLNAKNKQNLNQPLKILGWHTNRIYSFNMLSDTGC